MLGLVYIHIYTQIQIIMLNLCLHALSQKMKHHTMNIHTFVQMDILTHGSMMHLIIGQMVTDGTQMKILTQTVKLDQKVVLVAVYPRQVAELKEMVMHIDPKAFIIVQEAHQVLGENFATYSKESL